MNANMGVFIHQRRIGLRDRKFLGKAPELWGKKTVFSCKPVPCNEANESMIVIV